MAEGKCQDLTGLPNHDAARELRAAAAAAKAAVEAAVKAGADAFPAGTPVVLRGLQKRPELNGARGTIDGTVGANGRLVVVLDGDGGSFRALPSNLERADAAGASATRPTTPPAARADGKTAAGRRGGADHGSPSDVASDVAEMMRGVDLQLLLQIKHST